jgi:hypothetical protein
MERKIGHGIHGGGGLLSRSSPTASRRAECLLIRALRCDRLPALCSWLHDTMLANYGGQCDDYACCYLWRHRMPDRLQECRCPSCHCGKHAPLWDSIVELQPGKLALRRLRSAAHRRGR